MPDLHPSGSILAINSALRVALLPGNSRIPTSYLITLTGTAPSAAATTISYASITSSNPSGLPTVGSPLIIEDGTVLRFSGSNITPIIAQNDNPAIPYQTITSGGAGTLKVRALSGTLPAAAATATTLGLYDLLGIQGLDQSNSTNLISIRSQKSGLGNEQRATMVSYEISVSGWLHQRDLGFNNVIRPANNESKEIYLEAYFNDGRLISGVAGVSNLQYQNQLDDVIKVSYTIFIQGIPTESFPASYP